MQVARNEIGHVRILREALGADAPPCPKLDIDEAFGKVGGRTAPHATCPSPSIGRPAGRACLPARPPACLPACRDPLPLAACWPTLGAVLSQLPTCSFPTSR